MERERYRFFVQLLNKLNHSTDFYTTLQEELTELCKHLDYGVALTYENNNKKQLECSASQGLYTFEPPKIIENGFFVESDLNELRESRSLYFLGETPRTPLMQKVAEFFHAESVFLAPVFSNEDELIALVCLIDNRANPRSANHDTEFTQAVLGVLGNYLRTAMYLRLSENAKSALDSVLNNMGVDVYVNDFETHEFFYLNKSMAEPYGKAEDLVGKICWQELYDDKTCECDFCPKWKLIDENGNPTKTYSWDYMRPFDESWFRVFSSAFPWVDGRLAHVVTSVDITENKRNQMLIQRMAEYDVLSGLPNRARLNTDNDALIENREGKDDKIFALFLDLDGFKQINDTYGHAVGDAVLAEVGGFLQSEVFAGVRCYRYGGDEFVILCECKDRADLDEIIAPLLGRFSLPWEVSGKDLDCGVSVGISCYPDDTTLTSELLRLADMAMYSSKEQKVPSAHWYHRGGNRRWEPSK